MHPLICSEELAVEVKGEIISGSRHFLETAKGFLKLIVGARANRPRAFALGRLDGSPAVAITQRQPAGAISKLTDMLSETRRGAGADRQSSCTLTKRPI